MNQGTRNIIGGVLAGIWYGIWSIFIPLYMYTFLLGYTDALDSGLEFTQTDYENFRYWITAFGLISMAMVFFKASAPKYSKRKAIGQIGLVITNAFYFFIFVLSEVTIIHFETLIGDEVVDFSINFENMIYAMMGIYALNLIVAIYDLVIAKVAPIEIEYEYTEKHHNVEKTYEKYGKFLEE